VGRQCSQIHCLTLRSKGRCAIKPRSAPELERYDLEEMQMDTDNDFLRRYTDIPALLYLLKNEKITMLDPTSWDDRNDALYLSEYKEKKHLKSLLVLCFTEATETYHHWKVFAGGSSGVCVKFFRKQFLKEISKTNGIRHEKIKYPPLAEIRKKKPMTDELPFIKRYGFQDESEYRIIYESNKLFKTKDIKIPLSCINRITLSPWIPKKLSDSLKETIEIITSDSAITVGKSTLVSNEEWKTIGRDAS
jgi:hypothetical protein